jgi:2'-hydroxyisoflavone reductase
MRLLILGGTQFVGHAIVEAALARGHEVTIFHRGRHEAEFSRPVEVLHGDREGELSALRGGRWEAVIDTSGYVHEHVRASVELLEGAAEHYTFVSTISAYADFGERGITEDSAVRPAEERSREITGETYGTQLPPLPRYYEKGEKSSLDAERRFGDSPPHTLRNEVL